MPSCPRQSSFLVSNYALIGLEISATRLLRQCSVLSGIVLQAQCSLALYFDNEVLTVLAGGTFGVTAMRSKDLGLNSGNAPSEHLS